MRFFGKNGIERKGGQPVATRTLGNPGTDPGLLEQTLRFILDSIKDLQKKAKPEGTEFAIQLASSSSFKLRHNFGCPVRWYIVDIYSSGVGAPPRIVRNTLSSDLNTLQLDTGTGTTHYIIVRVEPSQFASDELQ